MPVNTLMKIINDINIISNKINAVDITFVILLTLSQINHNRIFIKKQINF